MEFSRGCEFSDDGEVEEEEEEEEEGKDDDSDGIFVV